MKASYPLKRIGNVEDVARAIAFLASDCGNFVTGERFHIDGGFQIT